jgi:hypothetical protein
VPASSTTPSSRKAGTSRSQTRRRSKGLAPLACKTDRIDSRVLAVLSHRDLVPAIWLPDPDQRGARARPLSPPPGRAQVGAQEPDPLDLDQLRQALPGHRPVRSRRPKAAGPTRGPRARARQHHRRARADRRPRRADRRDQRAAEGGPRRPPLHPAALPRSRGVGPSTCHSPLTARFRELSSHARSRLTPPSFPLTEAAVRPFLALVSLHRHSVWPASPALGR